MREGGREGKSHARGLEGEELNSQNTLHLFVAVWEQELPLMPVLYLLTNSSQRLQHSQWGRRVSRGVLGHCWLRLICFIFSVVIGSFLPFSRKGTSCLICPAHLTTDQRHPVTGGVRSALGETVQEKNCQLLLPPWSPKLLWYR